MTLNAKPQGRSLSRQWLTMMGVMEESGDERDLNVHPSPAASVAAVSVLIHVVLAYSNATC